MYIFKLMRKIIPITAVRYQKTKKKYLSTKPNSQSEFSKNAKITEKKKLINRHIAEFFFSINHRKISTINFLFINFFQNWYFTTQKKLFFS